MKKFLSLFAALVLGLAGAAANAATPKAAEDPSATVVSVGAPAPRGHKAPTAGKKAPAKKAAAKSAGTGKKVQKHTRTRGK